jgi:hypothetical protein
LADIDQDLDDDFRHLCAKSNLWGVIMRPRKLHTTRQRSLVCGAA